jgi:hypothetical protein
MKNLKLLLLLLLFFNLGRAQTVDTLEYDEEDDDITSEQLGICVYKSYTVKYVASLDSATILSSTRLTTNLITNIELLDSIDNYRISIDVDPVSENVDMEDPNMFSFIEEIAVDLSESDSNNVAIRKLEIYKSCECASSLYNIIMDSTTTFDKIPLSKFLGDKRVKRIDAVYVQGVLKKPKPHNVEYLHLRVYRRYRLFSRRYIIDLTDNKEEIL